MTDRRPTLLEIARLRNGAIAPEAAAELRARIEAHGPPDGPGLTDEQAFADQPQVAFVSGVRTRALAIRRLRTTAVAATGAAAVAGLLAVWPRGVESPQAGLEPGSVAPAVVGSEPGVGPVTADEPASDSPLLQRATASMLDPEPTSEPASAEDDLARRSGAHRSAKALAGDRSEPQSEPRVPGIIEPEPQPEPEPADPVEVAPLMPPHRPAWSPEVGGGGAADLESPPAADASLQDVVLYATFDDFRQGRVTGRTRARVMPRGVMGGERAAGEPGHFWALDLRARRGRALGKVYAFAAGGEVYVAEGAPRPNRSSLYGRLQRVGERGVLMQQVCFPVSQYGVMSCSSHLRLLDLTKGTSVDVSRRKLRKWLDSEPELRRRFDDEPRKNEETLRRYLVELLERDPAAVPASVRREP